MILFLALSPQILMIMTMNVTWCVLSIDVMAAIIRYMDWFSFIDALFSVLSNIHTLNG